MNYDLRGPFRLASLHYAIHLPLKKGKEFYEGGITIYDLRGTVQGSADFADFSGVEACICYYVCMVIWITKYSGGASIDQVWIKHR